MYDIIVLGAGFAGMTAALYGARAGKKVLIVEKNTFGGQITFSPKVENYPAVVQASGNELAENLIEQVIAAGAEVEPAEIKSLNLEGKVKKVITDGAEYEALSVIIALGAGHRPLGLPGDEELIGSGISYCAVCDGAFFKGKKVAVVGGGNTALQDALYWSAYCSEVYLVHRRDAYRAEKELVSRLADKPCIKQVLNATVKSLLANDGVLTGIEVSVKNSDDFKIALDGVFVAIGVVPETAITEGIDKDENGYIKAGEDCRTNIEGVFAAGDCRTKTVRQLVTAVADGAVSALAACEYTDRI